MADLPFQGDDSAKRPMGYEKRHHGLSSAQSLNRGAALKEEPVPYIIEANPDQARRPQLTSPRTQAVISPAALETVSPLKVVIAP